MNKARGVAFLDRIRSIDEPEASFFSWGRMITGFDHFHTRQQIVANPSSRLAFACC
jgi:hypothetical protein